jgi:holo-[acyl-carrier protein] synthase
MSTPLLLGLDAVDVERFRGVLGRRPGVLKRVFTEAERNDLAARADPVPGLAARFAAKEAAMKALGVGLGAVDLAELEVRRQDSGAPVLVVSGRALERARRLGVAAFEVSLTHTAHLAAAVVVAR